MGNETWSPADESLEQTMPRHRVSEDQTTSRRNLDRRFQQVFAAFF